MTVSPAAGVAPLNVAAAQPQPTNLHSVLAGGVNLGGSPASTDYGLPAIPGVGTAVAAATGPAPAASAPVVGGGGTQAAQGATNLDPAQLVPVLQQVVAAVEQLVAVLQAQGGTVSGGGAPAPGAVGQCGMPGCTMDHSVQQAAQGASGAPDAPAARRDAADGERKAKRERQSAAAPPSSGQAPQSYSGRMPKKLPGETSYSGLQEKSFRVLEAAHRHGLKLISGVRNGNTSSGHHNGSAIDVANVPGNSRQGSPEMRAYAEEMRAAGKAGDPNVGYVIYQQQIASATNNWAWRPMEDRGSNVANHFDHVHVSTDPKL